MLLQVFLSYKIESLEKIFDIDLRELLFTAGTLRKSLMFHVEIVFDAYSNISSNVQILEILGRMGTSVGCSDFWDRLNRQALVMIGRWYSRQPIISNACPTEPSHKSLR